MRVPQYSRDQRVGFNMTPMIDVVFLLIIFFLVSSHLAKQETRLELMLPQASSGEADIDDAAPRVTINVQADGSLLVGSRRVSFDDLPARLSERRQQFSTPVQVRIRSDREVPYRQIVPILRACTQAQVWDVSFAVYERQGEL